MKINLLILLSFFIFSCGNKKEKSTTKQTEIENTQQTIFPYKLEKPEKFTISDELKEISGISFDKNDNSVIFAEQDEEGKLFSVKLNNLATKAVKFGTKGDYEDVAIFNETVVILRSDGALITFPLKDFQENNIGKVQEWNSLIPKAEYEAMYADEKTNLIYILCKECEGESQKKSLKGYIISAATNEFTLKESFEIDVKAIDNLTRIKKFKPSGLAKNTKTNEFYILSAKNELMLVTDNNFNPLQVYNLPKSAFNQPEGIAFDNQNNLYISNEGDSFQKANILKFNSN